MVERTLLIIAAEGNTGHTVANPYAPTQPPNSTGPSSLRTIAHHCVCHVYINTPAVYDVRTAVRDIPACCPHVVGHAFRVSVHDARHGSDSAPDAIWLNYTYVMMDSENHGLQLGKLFA